jgi:hypothetical protein
MRQPPLRAQQEEDDESGPVRGAEQISDREMATSWASRVAAMGLRSIANVNIQLHSGQVNETLPDYP